MSTNSFLANSSRRSIRKELFTTNMLHKQQLYLLLCVFITRAEVQSVKRILTETSSLDKEDTLNALCVLWPELENPINLKDIFNCLEKERNETEDLLISLLKGDDQLIAMVEAESSTVENRYKTTRNFVESRLAALRLNIDIKDWKNSFLRARIIICNLVNPDPVFYKPLWNTIMTDDVKDQPFKEWVSGILKPLDHYNKRSKKPLFISEFEEMSSSEALQTFWNVSTSDAISLRAVLTFEILPYLRYSGEYSEFSDVILTSEKFQLDTLQNFQTYKHIALEMGLFFPKNATNNFQRQVLTILYENGHNLSRIPIQNVEHEIKKILAIADDDVTLESGIKASTLKSYANYLDNLKIYNLKDIYNLVQADELTQLSHFSSMCKQMLQSNPTVTALESVMSLVEDRSIFVKLLKEKQELVIIETLLTLSDFSLLNEFMTRSNFKIEESVLVKYFWRFFNNASNGRSNRPEMVKAKRTLDLLPERKYAYLTTLIEVADQLSQFSLNYERGVPFKPSHLLEFKSHPFVLVSKLLELNPGLYLKPDTTTDILRKLYTGLEIKPTTPNFEEEFTQILALHVDFSLANLDFQFAYEKTMVLLNRGNVSQYWSTIFQVGKFFDPNWIDSEIPTEIIYLQLEVLGKLLHICPEDEVEAVVSQWSGLELELSTRDIINDKYSLKNDTSSKEFQHKVIEEVSSSVSNFLSSGFKWAVGEDI